MILHFTRNLENIPFGAEEAVAPVKEAVSKIFPKGRWLSPLKAEDEQKLTQAFFFQEPFKALFIDLEHNLLIAIGKTDHLHLLFDGNYPDLKPHLQKLHQTLRFAFHPLFGFLTSSLETTGTGCKAKFFREILYPEKPTFIETIPFSGGYIYQNKTSIGILETTLIEQLSSLEKQIDAHVATIKTSTPHLLQQIFEIY